MFGAHPPPMLNCHNRQIILTIKHTSRQDFWHIIALQDSGEGEEGEGGSLLIWQALFFNDHLSAPYMCPFTAAAGPGGGEEEVGLPRGLQQLYLHLPRAPATGDSSSPPPPLLNCSVSP